jgi:hypothetical protein
MEVNEQSRRDFVKKLAYVTPVVLTLQAAPSTTRAGSGGNTRLRTPQREPAQRVPDDHRT